MDVQARGVVAAPEAVSAQPPALAAHLDEIISVVAPDGTVLSVNRGRVVEGRSEAEGRSSLGWVHPDDQAVVAEAFVRLVQDPETPTRTVVRVRQREGEPFRHMETTGVNRCADPAVGGLVFVSRDVEDRVRAEQQVAWSLRAQGLVAELGLRALTSGDLDALASDALRSTAELLGADYLTLLERDHSGDLRVTRQHGARPLPPGHLLPRGAVPDAPEMRDRGVQVAAGAPLEGASGAVGLLTAGWGRAHEVEPTQQSLLQSVANVLAGARQREQREVAAVVRALHCPLTGLPTRPLLLDRLDHALRRSARDGSEVAVLLLDLDGFKAVNDTHGHAAGDAVLAELGPRLATCVRPGDTAARLGGDEFVVLCEDLADPQAVIELRDRVRAVFDAPFTLPGGEQVRVLGSVGSAFSRSSGHDAAALLHAADLAMYRDKRRREHG